jgi:hypothetical protein
MSSITELPKQSLHITVWDKGKGKSDEYMGKQFFVCLFLLPSMSTLCCHETTRGYQKWLLLYVGSFDQTILPGKVATTPHQLPDTVYSIPKFEICTWKQLRVSPGKQNFNYLLKNYHPAPWWDSISRPIAPQAETTTQDHARAMFANLFKTLQIPKSN